MKGPILLTFLLFTILLTSCVDEFDNTTTEIGDSPPITTYVESELIGYIYNTNGGPMRNVNVSIGQYSVQTNIGGYFDFGLIEILEGGDYLEISLDGHFNNYKIVYPEPGVRQFVQAMMARKSSLGDFDSAAGGTIGSGARMEVTFEPNSIVDEQGNPYSGQVTVYEQLINQDNPNFAMLTPGDFRGIDAAENEVILLSYAMAVIQLEGQEGQKLNLANETTARLSFPVPSIALPSAPENISLWHFDDNSKKWLEEGQANLVNDRYIGEVSHFSYWNCDTSGESAKLSMTLLSENGTPYADALVVLKAENKLTSAAGFTDRNGFICELVPTGIDFEIIVFFDSDNCVPGLRDFISGVDEDTDIGVVRFNQAEPHIVSGKVVDCDNNPIPFASIILDTREFVTEITDANGEFEFNLGPCLYGGNYYYQTFDPSSNTYSKMFGFGSINNLEVIEDLGDVVHCHEAQNVSSVGSECCLNTDQVTASVEVISDIKRNIVITATDENWDTFLEFSFEVTDRSDLLVPTTIRSTGFQTQGFSNAPDISLGSGGRVKRFRGRGLPGEQISGEFQFDLEDDYSNNIDYIIPFIAIIEQ